MSGVFAATHPCAGIHLSIVEVFALASTSHGVDGSVRSVLATTVSDLARSQDHRVRIITDAETAASVDGCPFVFALALPRGIEVSVRVGALAHAVSVERRVVRVLAAANAGARVHLGVFEVFALTRAGHLVRGSVRGVLAAAVADLTSR
jgi:hypothetical protein